MTKQKIKAKKAKVNESKMRKNKSKDGNKKDLPTGPGGLREHAFYII